MAGLHFAYVVRSKCGVFRVGVFRRNGIFFVVKQGEGLARSFSCGAQAFSAAVLAVSGKKVIGAL